MLLNQDNIDTDWKLLCDKVHGFVSKHKPIRGVIANKSKQMPLSKTQRELLKKKNKLWKKQKSNNSQDRKEYNKIRNKVKSMIRKARREYEAEIASKAKLDPKVVWSYMK